MKKQIRINKKIASLFFAVLIIASPFVAFITPAVAELPPAGEAVTWSFISSGISQTLAIRTDGTLWAWGRNTESQLGLGDNTNRNIPTQVGTDTNWVFVDTAFSHTLAIKTDGTLWAWGSNWSGELGLGGIDVGKNIPTQVGTDTNWASVSGGRSAYTIAIKTDGTLWAWGENGSGQLGLGDNAVRNIPTQVGTDTNWSSIYSSNHHATAIRTDGTLWAWGTNLRGQLGLGDNINKNIPTQVGTDTNWASVFGGWEYTTAIKTNGTLWAWGRNNAGQLGLGDNLNKNIPTQVGTDTNWASVSSGDSHSVAIKTDGTLWVWGDNLENKLGLILEAGVSSINTPTQVGADTNWASVSSGESYSMAIKTDGTLWGWGSSFRGQLGFGDATNRQTPTQLPTISIAPSSLSFGNVALGTYSYLTFTVTNTGGGTLTGTASVPVGLFSITDGASYSITTGATHVVTIRFAPIARGLVSATVTFTGGGSTTRTILGGAPLPTFVALLPIISIAPAELSFSNVAVGETRDLTFTITNIGTGSLRGIASIPVGGPFSIVAGTEYNIGTPIHTVTVRFASTVAGSVSDTITFTGGGGATRTVSGVGTQPVISIIPTELSFGSVNVGTTREFIFVVTNVSSGTLTGTASVPTGSFSIIAGASYNITAGATHVVIAKFAPTVAGPVSDTITFTGGGGATRTVSGVGTAVSLPPPTVPPVVAELPQAEIPQAELPPTELPPAELPPVAEPPAELPSVAEPQTKPQQIPYWIWIMLAIMVIVTIARAIHRKIKKIKRQ